LESRKAEARLLKSKKTDGRTLPEASGKLVFESHGLVLDDYLWEVQRWRLHFNLPTPNFSLSDIEENAKAKEEIQRLIYATVERHGSEIYSAHHPMLDDVSPEVYSDSVSEGPYPRPGFLHFGLIVSSEGYWKLDFRLLSSCRPEFQNRV
jgi:hypothetical protein